MRRVLGVLALAAGAALVWAVWQAERPKQGLAPMPEWPVWSAQAVKAIEIKVHNEPKLRLVREGEAWQACIGKQPCKPARAEQARMLLDLLAKMRPVRLVARGHAHDAQLGLAGKTAVRLRVLGEKDRVLLDATVGRQASGAATETYLRLGDDPRVIAVDQALVWLVRRPAQDWLQPAEGGKASKSD